MPSLPPSMMQSLVLFLLICAGFAAGKTRTLTPDNVRALSRFLVDYTLPAVIIVSMQRPFSPALRDQALRILGLSMLFYAASFPLAYLATMAYRKAGRPELGVHRFAMCFSNVAFMGFPVAESMLGKDSLFILSIYNIPFQILAFSIGIVMISGRGSARGSVRGSVRGSLRSLVNPSIVSAVAGFALFLGSVSIPEPLYSAMDLLGGMTTPLAMIVIGATLAHTRIGGVMANPRLWLTTTYRLALLPALTFVAAKALGLSGMELSIPVLVAAMPVAANSTILAGVYGGDDVTASALVFASTLLSLVTIPALGYLIV